jgi:hypothetical protein
MTCLLQCCAVWSGRGSSTSDVLAAPIITAISEVVSISETSVAARLHSSASQQRVIFILDAVSTLNLTKYCVVFYSSQYMFVIFRSCRVAISHSCLKLLADCYFTVLSLSLSPRATRPSVWKQLSSVNSNVS